MAIFFHAISGGFYLDEVNGPRTVFKADPEWTQPYIKVPDPKWVPDVEGGSQEAPLISVPDPKALPPQVEVPNESCSLPPVHDLIEISKETYLALLAAQSLGKVIQANNKGGAEAVEPSPPNNDELARRERLWCERVIAATDSMVVLYRDELEAGRSTTLSSEHYKELQAYRFALRDWPAAANFPDPEYRPASPSWFVSA